MACAAESAAARLRIRTEHHRRSGSSVPWYRVPPSCRDHYRGLDPDDACRYLRPYSVASRQLSGASLFPTFLPAVEPVGLLACNFLNRHQVTDLVYDSADRRIIVPDNTVVDLSQTEGTNRVLLVCGTSDGAA